ncbi:biopolymer transporter ExbD, partial [Mariniblastus sp.]|nr:biopolymer transporter ExbD [Mariniblastus sp.]
MSKKKKKKSQPDPNTDGEGFGLNKPTGQFSDLDIEMKKKLAVEREELASQIYRPTPEDGPDDVTYKNMGWRGMEEVEDDDDDDEPDVAFEKKEIPEDELDMTPMVDVTFLLLIFFMVTASFTLQKSLEQPPAKSDQPSTEVQEDDEILDDYVQVTIDQTNTYYVTTRDDEEVECPSDSEMRSRVKDAKETTSATRMIILAHVDST